MSVFIVRMTLQYLLLICGLPGWYMLQTPRVPSEFDPSDAVWVWRPRIPVYVVTPVTLKCVCCSPNLCWCER